MNLGLLHGLTTGRVEGYEPRFMVQGIGTTEVAYGAYLFGNPGTSGRYVVTDDGWCHGYASVSFQSGGSGGGPTGGVYQLELPVMAREGSDAIVGDYNLGSAYVVSSGAATFGLLYVALDNSSNGELGRWAQINLPHVEISTVATVLNTTSAITINHGFAKAPSGVQVTPRNSDPGQRWWYSGLSDTQVTVNTTAAVSGNKDFLVTAFRTGVQFAVGDPFAFGGTLDHIDAQFSYPVA